MDERDRDRAFADSRRYTLNISCAHVANRKHAGYACFKQVWPAVQEPFSGVQVFRRQIGAGLNKTLFVERNTSVEPGRIGFGSCHQEHMGDVLSLGFAGFVVPP